MSNKPSPSCSTCCCCCSPTYFFSIIFFYSIHSWSTDFITTVKLTGSSLKLIGLFIESVIYILTQKIILVFNLLYNLLLGSTLKGYAREIFDVSKKYTTSVDTPPSKESVINDVLIFILSTEFVMFGKMRCCYINFCKLNNIIKVFIHASKINTISCR